MLKNYLKITYRNLKRFKGYTFINIMGLSIGLSCFVLVMLYIQDELSYNNYHEKADQLYRIVEKNYEGGKINYLATTPAPLAPLIENTYPEIHNVTRFGGGMGDEITYNDKQTRNNKFLLADQNVFEVFSIPLIKGDSKKALSDISSVVISETLAKKYFGEKDPLGEIIQIGRGGYQRNYKITGVFKDLPHNSTLQFDCLASFQCSYIDGNEGNLTWGAKNFDTFILLPKGYDPKLVEPKLTNYVNKHRTESSDIKTEYCLQPITDIYISLNPWYDLPTERNSTDVYTFSCIAFLILLIACINFINLSTARASTREKEVGVRKVVGAGRTQLVNQFLGESVLLAFLALLLSIPIIEMLLPVFNQYTDKELILFDRDNILLLTCLPAMTLIVGILAGSFPALYISSFKPISIFTGRLSNAKTNTKAGLRKVLVITQFVIAIIFITCMMGMHTQLQYLKNKNLGYNKEHLVIIPIYDPLVKSRYELYRTEILRNHNIINASATSYLPSELGNCQNFHIKNEDENTVNYINWMSVDYDFIQTMGLKLTSGRNFSKEFSSDNGSAYILNESAVKQIGWKNPLGEQMDIIGWGKIVGVVKDFHFQSLHNKIVPMALCIYPDIFQYMLVRIKKDDIPNSISFLEKKWGEIFPNRAFEFNFYDKEFDKVYKNEIRFGNILNLVSAIAILLACLGLFGLVYFSTERRTKEIGIRKVVGASATNILFMITKDFIKWILIAYILASPVSYFLINKWLQDFAYRTNMSWWIFAISGSIILLIMLVTISFQSIKAAKANPVESLKYE